MTYLRKIPSPVSPQKPEPAYPLFSWIEDRNSGQKTPRPVKSRYSLFRIINYLIDKFTGFRILEETKNILEMDTWTREEILAYQDEKFQRLAKAAEKSEFYRAYAGKPLEEYPVMDRERL